MRAGGQPSAGMRHLLERWRWRHATPIRNPVLIAIDASAGSSSNRVVNRLNTNHQVSFLYTINYVLLVNSLMSAQHIPSPPSEEDRGPIINRASVALYIVAVLTVGLR